MCWPQASMCLVSSICFVLIWVCVNVSPLPRLLTWNEPVTYISFITFLSLYVTRAIYYWISIALAKCTQWVFAEGDCISCLFYERRWSNVVPYNIMWNYWRVEYLAIHSKMQMTRLIISGFWSTVWEKTHAYSLNGVHLIWQYLRDSINRHIKAITKYTTYTVYQ